MASGGREYKIYADGSCLKNPGGKGGWATVTETSDGQRIERSGGAPSTTNNRMELEAANNAVRNLPPNARGTVYCDSEYVVKGVNEWRRSWEARDYHNVKNEGQWRDLHRQVDQHPNMRFEHVRGHAGHPGNERADQLARDAAHRQ